MPHTKKLLSAELLGVEAALRRAGLKAKQEAERLGIPYIVADRKDSVAEANLTQQQKGKPNMKTIFELVKVVLDELYEETKNMHASEVETDEAIIYKMNYLSKKYTKLTDKASTVIDYKDSATRFANFINMLPLTPTTLIKFYVS